MKSILPVARNSLKWQLLGRVLFLVMILIPVFGLVRYQVDRKSLNEQFERQINGAIEVLSVSMRMPLWELDEIQIEEAVRSLSYLPDLRIVRITDSEPSLTERLFVRNQQDQMSRLYDTSALKIDAPVQRSFIITLKNNETAQGMLYFSDTNYKAAMRHSIIMLALQLGIFSFLIITAMYFLVQRYVGSPLARLSVALAPDAAPDLLETTIARLAGNELRTLVERYQNVLQELRGHKEHLTDKVMQRTHALSESNQLLRHEIERRALLEQELIQARIQADQANEAKTFFLAHMSHELRTPLNGILGYSQLLTAEKELPASVREKIANIDSCGQHLLQLINRILDLIKIEEGQILRIEEAFGLQQLLNDVITIVQPTATQKGLLLKSAGVDDLPVAVIGDGPHLRQVLINLLGNAIKYTEQGEVTLSAARIDDKRISFTVADTGHGIPERDLERIFEPFQQSGSASTQAKGGGTGLGLPIARKLVQLMGGELTARSIIEEGSEFRFILALPLADSSALPSEARRIIGIEGQVKPRVLIVDDVLFNRDVLKQQLEGLGFEADTAASAKEALEKLSQQLPDIVFMDLRMPEMDGVTCTKIIRKSTPNLPILAFTASVFDADVNQEINANFDGLVLKPVDLQQTCQEIAACFPVQFIYEEKAESATISADKPAMTSVMNLSQAELAQLRNWLNSGAVASIRGFAETLYQRDPVLCEQLLSLARAYDIEGLRRLIA